MILAFLKIDHTIDLITNSSSELFVMEAKTSKQLVVEMLNEALKGATSVSINSIEDRIIKECRPSDADWRIDDALTLFPEETREELKAKYLTEPNYFGVSFDRDWVYEMDNKGIYIRDILSSLGFELIDTDY
jgi:hypothetical protein